jgi:hypothetical protein
MKYLLLSDSRIPVEDLAKETSLSTKTVAKDDRKPYSAIYYYNRPIFHAINRYH